MIGGSPIGGAPLGGSGEVFVPLPPWGNAEYIDTYREDRTISGYSESRYIDAQTDERYL